MNNLMKIPTHPLTTSFQQSDRVYLDTGQPNRPGCCGGFATLTRNASEGDAWVEIEECDFDVGVRYRVSEVPMVWLRSKEEI